MSTTLFITMILALVFLSFIFGFIEGRRATSKKESARKKDFHTAILEKEKQRLDRLLIPKTMEFEKLQQVFVTPSYNYSNYTHPDRHMSFLIEENKQKLLFEVGKRIEMFAENHGSRHRMIVYVAKKKPGI